MSLIDNFLILAGPRNRCCMIKDTFVPVRYIILDSNKKLWNEEFNLFFSMLKSHNFYRVVVLEGKNSEIAILKNMQIEHTIIRSIVKSNIEREYDLMIDAGKRVLILVGFPRLAEFYDEMDSDNYVLFLSKCEEIYDRSSMRKDELDCTALGSCEHRFNCIKNAWRPFY